MSRHKKSRLECYIALIHRSFRLSIHSGKSEPEFLSIHRHICCLRSFPFFHPLRHCHLYCSSSAPPILHLSSHYQYCILAQKSILRLWIPACTSGQSCIAASSHSTSACLPYILAAIDRIAYAGSSCLAAASPIPKLFAAFLDAFS